MKKFIPSIVIISTIFLMPSIVHAQELKEIYMTTSITQTQETSNFCLYQSKIWDRDFNMPIPDGWNNLPMKGRLPKEKRLPNKDILFPKNIIDGRNFV